MTNEERTELFKRLRAAASRRWRTNSADDLREFLDDVCGVDFNFILEMIETAAMDPDDADNLAHVCEYLGVDVDIYTLKTELDDKLNLPDPGTDLPDPGV